ncbi:MAG: zinc transporter ZupT [Thermodesulfovibrionales bacterium]|nr:zinc transporter ZupT [Thermodesulfovibrionales bacterium]
MDNLIYALGLTLFAGLATGIGSIIAFTAKRTNHRFLSVATGFSAGVMLYVSFVEIFYKGQHALTSTYGDYWGSWINILSFFAGILLIGVIDNLIPSSGNPHETHPDYEMELVQFKHDNDLKDDKEIKNENPEFQGHSHSKLMRMGLFTALAITIHNFPEGLATFLSALQDPKLGFAIAIAVALHNIPEGISVSVPIYFATGDRKKAFFYSLFSGLAEPFGAIIAYIAIYFWIGGEFGIVPSQLLGILFAGVAGIMVYISLDELLPTSRAYGKGHDSLFGLIGGMLIMSISLVLMK